MDHQCIKEIRLVLLWFEVSVGIGGDRLQPLPATPATPSQPWSSAYSVWQTTARVSYIVETC